MTEQAIQHAVMQVPGQPAIDVPDPAGKSTLTVRLPAGMKRRFAAMAGEMGMSQQFLIEQWTAAALDEYDRVMASRRAKAT